jgi:hypothetical protein
MQPATSWDELRDRIERFLLGLARPVLTEPGREVLDLSSCRYSLSTQYNKLLWHVWNDQTNLVRQITAIRKETAGRMEIQYQKFGKGPPGTLILAESRAAPERVARRSERTRYAQGLRRALGQLFPQWKAEELSTEADLEHSLSGRYARGVLRRGQQVWAVIGSGEQEDPSAAEGILTYGLIWLDWLRRREPAKVITGLKLFVPPGRAATTLHRLAWLDPHLAQWEVYESGEELRRCDLADVGNLKTSLGPAAEPKRHSSAVSSRPPSVQRWGERIESISPFISSHTGVDGFRSWAVYGLPFAKETSQGTAFGIGRSETALDELTFPHLEQLARKLLKFRSPESPDRLHPFYRLWPERWMQSQLVREIERLGYDLVPGAMYEQLPAVSGAERGVMDLLTLDSGGRLVVLELKASEDIHLPLQALDYWMRVHWHHQRGEFEQGRYFGGRKLKAEPPLLLLVSPALQFHAACEIVLRYFSPAIEAVRIGLNEEWRERVQVVLRVNR